MMEGIFFILIFVGVIAITALLFGVWIIVAIVRMIFRGLGLLVGPATRLPPMPNTRPLGSIRCPNDRCNGVNPMSARFCRRCGTALEAQRVHAHRHRAAMWCCW